MWGNKDGESTVQRSLGGGRKTEPSDRQGWRQAPLGYWMLLPAFLVSVGALAAVTMHNGIDAGAVVVACLITAGAFLLGPEIMVLDGRCRRVEPLTVPVESRSRDGRRSG